MGEEFSSSDEDIGKVISQEPQFKKNYTIKENTKFELKISKGVEKVKVPKVSGMKYEDAVRELEKYKLKAEKLDEKSNTVEEGVVTTQETAEGTEVSIGSTVILHVSIGNGLAKISVPYVIGKTQDEAINELKNSKLKVEVATKEDKTKNSGEVLEQSITVGQVVEEGTTIVITVNKIEEIKTGTVYINLKKLVPYVEEEDEEGEILPAAKVGVRVTVGEDTVYNENVASDNEKLEVKVEGIGTVNVKVYIKKSEESEVLKAQTNLNLNSENVTWTAE